MTDKLAKAQRKRVEEARKKIALFQFNLQRKHEGVYEQTWDEVSDVIKESHLEWADQILNTPITIANKTKSIAEIIEEWIGSQKEI